MEHVQWLLYACFHGVDILRLGHCMLPLLNKTGGEIFLSSNSGAGPCDNCMETLICAAIISYLINVSYSMGIFD